MTTNENRPPKEDMKKTSRVHRLFIRMTPKERDHVKACAAECGLSVSQYMRATVKKGAPLLIIPPELMENLRYLKSLSNNMNQLAHVANASGDPHAEEFHAEALRVRALVDQLQELVKENGHDPNSSH